MVRNGEVTARYETGSSRPFASRPIPYVRYLFPISLNPRASTDLFIRVRGYPGMALQFPQLWPEQKLQCALRKHDAMEWATIGVMFVATLAAAIVWLIVRHRILGLFVLLVTAQLMGRLISGGYAFAWLWPNSPTIQQIAEAILVPISLSINVIFSIAYLNVRKQAPRLYRVAQIALFALAALALLTLIWPVVVEIIGQLSMLVIYPLLIGMSYYLFLYGHNRFDAGAFLLCWISYAAVIVAAIVISALDSSLWYSLHLVDFAAQLRILLFAACLGYRFRQIMRNEESARAETRAKSEFLARMSHEIRTPMNGILGMTELLRGAGLNHAQRRYNDIVYSSATALLTVINDILDFSKIQAGRMSMEKIAFDLHRVAVDVLTLFRAKATEKNLELLCDIQPNVPAWVMGDPTRLRQILINLLSNAVKFTAAGEVRLRIANKGEQIHIAVEDTGPGIAPETQSRLFESFMQADTSVARSHGGTGLGLAITLQLAELMGGKVGVQSQLGRGSIFWVELPLPATATQKELLPATELQEKSIEKSQSALTLLVVEDNPVNQIVIQAMLKTLGHHFQVASNGEEAVTLYASYHNQFDLVLMDCEMPIMDGYEATRRIRTYERQQLLPQKIIIAQSAHSLDEHIRWCHAAGMNGHLAKPLSVERLRGVIAELMEGECVARVFGTDRN